jgi:hypothetical protein
LTGAFCGGRSHLENEKKKQLIRGEMRRTAFGAGAFLGGFPSEAGQFMILHEEENEPRQTRTPKAVECSGQIHKEVIRSLPYTKPDPFVFFIPVSNL